MEGPRGRARREMTRPSQSNTVRQNLDSHHPNEPHDTWPGLQVVPGAKTSKQIAYFIFANVSPRRRRTVAVARHGSIIIPPAPSAKGRNFEEAGKLFATDEPRGVLNSPPDGQIRTRCAARGKRLRSLATGREHVERAPSNPASPP
jgi:hypothetical protein